MPDGEITLGEVNRSLISLEQRINLQFSSINKRLDSLQFVPRGEYEIQIRNLKDEVDELQESKKWLVRSLVISFLFPLLIAVVVATVVVK
jgi:hypothetical protein